MAAGWEEVEEHREESWEFGDSVAVDLVRAGVCIEIEYYEHGAITGFPMDDPDLEIDDEPTKPLFHLDDSTPDELSREFEHQGWLRRQ